MSRLSSQSRQPNAPCSQTTDVDSVGWFGPIGSGRRKAVPVSWIVVSPCLPKERAARGWSPDKMDHSAGEAAGRIWNSMRVGGEAEREERRISPGWGWVMCRSSGGAVGSGALGQAKRAAAAANSSRWMADRGRVRVWRVRGSRGKREGAMLQPDVFLVDDDAAWPAALRVGQPVKRSPLARRRRGASGGGPGREMRGGRRS